MALAWPAAGLAAFALLAVPAAQSQQELPRELKLLLGIKQKMTRNLARMPNYTCLETISRATRDPRSMVVNRDGKTNRFRRTDVFRLEVAEVGGDELFARPGQHDFHKQALRDLVPTGMMGNGVFSILAHSVFQTNAAVVHFGGEEKMEGRTLYRFDFDVSELVSNYAIRTTGGEAVVGYHGSFWADPETLDPVRMDYAAIAIPARLGISASETRIDYAVTRIGDADVLLPQNAEMIMSQDSGWADRNQIAFTHCKEYGVSSAISFGEVPGDVTDNGAGKGTNDIELPAGLHITIRLEAPIQADHVYVGELVMGRVDEDVKLRRDVVIPKGALVFGRVRRVENAGRFVVALEFSRIEFNGRRARFIAEMEKLVAPPGITPGIKGIRQLPSPDVPGVGTILVPSAPFRLTTETRMVWKTTDYRETLSR